LRHDLTLDPAAPAPLDAGAAYPPEAPETTRPRRGRRVVRGLNGLTEGALDDPEVRGDAFRRARERGFIK